MAMNGIAKIIVVLLSLAQVRAPGLSIQNRVPIPDNFKSLLWRMRGYVPPPNCEWESWTSPSAAYSDYIPRPTPKPYVSPHMRESSVGNQYPDSTTPTIKHTVLPVDVRNKPRQHFDDNPIIYPDTKAKASETSCMYGLCVNVAEYPKQHIQNILSRSDFGNGFFESSENSVIIDNRFNTGEMALCDTKVHTIYPEKANNTMKVEKVIVNVEGHRQGIVFETCVDNGKCKFSSNFPSEYTSFCKQKYIHKRLMVLGDNDKFVFDSFEVPSCCVCTVTRTN